MKLTIAMLFSIAAFAQPRQGFNVRQVAIWRFVGAMPDSSGLLKCSSTSRPSCPGVAAAWSKFFVASKQWEGPSGIAATDSLLRKIADGDVQPKLGCVGWDCGDSIKLLARINTLRDLATKAKKEYTRALIQASASDDALADILAAQVFK